MVPTLKLVYLVLLGAPLWLLALAAPFGWVFGAGYFAFLLALCLRERRSFPHRDQIDVRRVVPPRLARGDTDEIALELENRGDVPLSLEVHDEVPDALRAVGDDPRGDLPPGGRARLSYPVEALQRGRHRFGRVVVRATHGIGLLRSQIAFDLGDEAKVYPRFRGVDDYRLLAMIDQRDEVVRRPRRLRGVGTDFESLRPYVPGEDLRSVDWKATARRGALTCRNMQVEKGQHLAALTRRPRWNE